MSEPERLKLSSLRSEARRLQAEVARAGLTKGILATLAQLSREMEDMPGVKSSLV